MNATSARRQPAYGGTTRQLLLSLFVGGSGLATTAFVARDAQAQPSGYEAPGECPDASAFDAAVARRAPGVTTDGARVSITGSRSRGYDGRLVLDGHVRDVHGAACGETVEALALAVAMAAIVDEHDVEPREPPVRARPTPPPPASFAEERAPERTPPPDGARHAVVGAGFGGASGVGRGVAPAVTVFGGIDTGARSVRIGASAVWSSELATELGTASFDRWAFHVDGCPVSAAAGVVRIAPCGGFDAGVLRGSGRSLENAESTPLLWLAISAGGRLAVELSKAFFVEGETRAVFPLLHHGFYVRPSTPLYRVPVVATETNVSLGYRFSK